MFRTSHAPAFYSSAEHLVLIEKYNNVCHVVHELRDIIRKLEEKIVEIESNKKQEKVRKQVRCKFFNTGFCKKNVLCPFQHPETICQRYLEFGKCHSFRTCPNRHPRECRYWKRGECFRGDGCLYLQQQVQDSQEVQDEEEVEDTREVEEVEEVEKVDEVEEVEKVDEVEEVNNVNIIKESRVIPQKKLITLDVNGKKIVVSKLEEIDNETFAALSLDDIAKFYVDDYNEESVDKNINTSENEVDLKKK